MKIRLIHKAHGSTTIYKEAYRKIPISEPAHSSAAQIHANLNI